MNDQSPSRSLQTLRAGAAPLLPIYPTTFDDVVRLARMAIISGMIKPLTKGWGDDQETERPEATEARATMIIMGGMELGLPPMQSVQLIAMINGRMTVHSEGVPGLLLSKGFKIRQQFVGTEYEPDYAAVCTLTRPDGEVNETRFTVKDAIEAGLWQTSATIKKKRKNDTTYEVPNDSPWWKYKKRMLWARALGFNSKDFASDAMKGLMVREEVEDMIRSGQIVDITPDALPAPRQPLPDVPEIPDDPVPEVPEDDASDIADPVDEALSPEQERIFLEKLKDDLAYCKTPAEREEVALANDDILNRMSDPARRKAEAIIEGRSK